MSSKTNNTEQLYALLCITVFLSLPIATLAQETTKLPGVAECVDLHDSLHLCYTYVKAEKKKPSAVIVTLPMMGRERDSFDGVVAAIDERFSNIAFINFDLRGHGLSVAQGSDSVSYRTMEKSEFVRMPHDIKEAMRLVRNRHKTLRNVPVYVIGASIGANTAGALANMEDLVKGAALLSPGLEYRGLIPGPHLKMTDDKNILIMVGKNDTYSYTSADSLYRLTAGARTLHVYNTAAHGTNIPNKNPQALEDLLAWLGAAL